MMEVMSEMKTMIELLEGFMSWFPSDLHPDINFPDYLVKISTTTKQPLLSCPTLCYSSP